MTAASSACLVWIRKSTSVRWIVASKAPIGMAGTPVPRRQTRLYHPGRMGARKGGSLKVTTWARFRAAGTLSEIGIQSSAKFADASSGRFTDDAGGTHAGGRLVHRLGRQHGRDACEWADVQAGTELQLRL